MRSDQELIAGYMGVFINRTDIWFRQWVDPSGKCNYACVKPDCKNYEPVSADLLGRHLNGEVTMSFPAISERYASKWCCWDSDSEDGSIESIEMVLHAIGFRPVRESVRPGRDGHLWLFFDAEVPANDLIRFHAEILSQAQVQDVRTLEFFPKSATKHSQVRGPLGIHRKPEADNARGWFQDVEKDVRKQLAWLLEQKLNSAIRLNNIVQALRLQDQFAVKPVTAQVPRRDHSASRLPMLELVPADHRKWNGHEWQARCPVCANEMHDRSGDNLRISGDGAKFCCVYGGPGVVHSARQIIAAFK